MRPIRDALALLITLTILTGLAYPLALTGIARLVFPARASGSFVLLGDRLVGSSLLGQEFVRSGHLWGRPSATPERPYNAGFSRGSNQGPLNPALLAAVRSRLRELRRAPGTDPALPVPVDLATSSASGLDPDISPAAALYQVGRIASARGVPAREIREVILRHIEPRWLGLLGEPRVNVLRVNLELDRRFGPAGPGCATREKP